MKKIVTLITCLLLGASLNADTVKGPYVGIGFGASQFNDGGFTSDLNKYFVNTASSLRVSKSFSSTAYKLYGGYQFNKIIAIEASYTSYGVYTYDYNDGTEIKINPTSLGLSANIGYNFGKKEEFRPFAKIGVAAFNINDSGSRTLYSDDKATSLIVGAGFDYNPTFLNGLGFRLAYEGDFFGLNVNNTGVSPVKSDYTQSANMYYFGIQYKF